MYITEDLPLKSTFQDPVFDWNIVRSLAWMGAVTTSILTSTSVRHALLIRFGNGRLDRPLRNTQMPA
jgi:hypothetical protein